MRTRYRLTGIVMARTSPAVLRAGRRQKRKMPAVGSATLLSNKILLAPDAVLFSGGVRFATDVITTGRSGRRR